jgi:hypothetical protein
MTPKAATFAELMAAAKPLLKGKAIYSVEEMHALGPLVTMAGTESVLPVTAEHDPFPSALKTVLDARGKWADATAATIYTTESLLAKTNTSVFAVQAPTCMPFLVDAIIDAKMATFWMQDMCNASSPQHAAMEALVERSGHFDNIKSGGKGGLYYMGWFNHTHEPNPELMEECTLKHSLITLASDQSDNLSFLNKVGAKTKSPFVQPPLFSGGQPKLYSPTKAYVSILVSDGDNIAEDWATLRPMLEERVQSMSKVPVGWTISNRWLQWGPAVLDWAYAQAAKTTTDSFLMGPSGYGYLFPGNMSASADKDWFAHATVEAATALEMTGYIHWDVDLFMDNATTKRTEDYLKRFEGTAVDGAFMLGSDPLPPEWPVKHPYESPTWVGDVACFKPIYQYGPPNVTTASAAVNTVPPGSMVYVYIGLGSDMHFVDGLAAAVADHIELVGYRELIELAKQKKKLQDDG